MNISKTHRLPLEEQPSPQKGNLKNSFSRSKAGILATAISLGGLTGCTMPSVGPDFKTVETPQAATFKTEGVANTETPAATLESEWWKDFGDAELNHLIETALAENQGLVGAIARVEQARALAGEAQSAYLPSVGATGLDTREQTSETTTNQFPHSLTTTYRLPLTLSWELDLFGRVRRLNESARAGLRAAEDLAQATRLSVASETASVYFAIAATDQEERIQAQTLTLQREMLKLVEARRDAGRSNDLAVEQAQLAVATVEADLAGILNRRSALKNGLAILLGKAAPSFDLAERAELVGTIPGVPVGLPSEILRRRPDLAAAESGMRAANAQIGVAKAAFFPAISLTGSGGFASAEIDSLFKTDSRAWSLTPSIYLPLFQGGRNRAHYKRSMAAYDESVASYRQAVLNAFREVQDALTASQRLKEQNEAIGRAVANARRARALADERFLAGSTGYLEVIDAQRVVLSLERTSAALAGQRRITQVSLIRALGGGWQQPSTN